MQADYDAIQSVVAASAAVPLREFLIEHNLHSTVEALQHRCGIEVPVLLRNDAVDHRQNDGGQHCTRRAVASAIKQAEPELTVRLTGEKTVATHRVSRLPDQAIAIPQMPSQCLARGLVHGLLDAAGVIHALDQLQLGGAAAGDV